MEILEKIHFTNEFWIIILPLVLMALDVITGYINALIKKETSSSVMRKGLGHKFAEIVYIALGLLISLAFGVSQIEYFISIYIIVMEVISILENCEKLGLKTPDFVKKQVDEVKENLEDKGE